MDGPRLEGHEKMAIRVIFEHFGHCSGDPEAWDARRFAIRLFLNESARRSGRTPIHTSFYIHPREDVRPEVVLEMANEAFEVAVEAVEYLHEYQIDGNWDEALRYAPTDPGCFVYFAQAVSGGPIKIGVSRDISARLATLQTGSPLILRILGFQEGSRAIEAALHRRFAAHHVHNEWFEPCEALLGYIEGLKG